jgi:hypothetical protein
MPICNDTIKERDIHFATTDSDQAERAMQLLTGVPGIDSMKVTNAGKLHIRYDVQALTWQMIESALSEVGFKLDDGVLLRIKRAVYSYCEEALRASLGVEQQNADKPSLTLSKDMSHDPRPDNWRNYV